MKRAVPLVLVLLLAGPAAAETLLHLSESARVMVRPDELAAMLRAEAVAATAAEAQAQVNTAMAGAVALARQTAGVAVTTGFYSVWQSALGPRATGRQEWRGNQTLALRSGDGAVLLTLVGTLQQRGLAVSQLGWQMAAETARRARAEATRQALGGLRARAEEAAGILGLHFDNFRDVRLDAARPQPKPMRAMVSGSAGSAPPPPVAEAEEVAVEASVAADVVLK
jgi:predicted secreted protein